MAIQAEIYADNDADIEVTDIPSGLTVEWFIAQVSGGNPPPPSATAIHAEVSGTCTEPTPGTYKGVLQGAAITSQLLPSYGNQQVALIVRVGQDLRVYGLTTVRAAKLVQ